ncbi:ras-like protein family member 12 isoform X1 [Siniperca chuatsi]|uniref:ras-like protein family member 12 isoform X1 n=1 Tax=Siniperca chuatsi TaxID=119488 RepID=UPI001CE21CBF|nr:ras-like protein family member 12 isoform X1 [Siniperca chuatsi]
MLICKNKKHVFFNHSLPTCNSGAAAAPDRSPADCNLVLLGVMGSGKSALTVKFLTKRFISEYDPHLEDIYSSEEIVDQQPVTVRVMDTCDQVCSSHLPPSYSLAFQENLTSDLHCSTSSRCPCIACLLSPASSQPAVFTQSTGSQRLPPHSWRVQGTVSAICRGPAPSLWSTASTTWRALKAASCICRRSPCTTKPSGHKLPSSCWGPSWTWTDTGWLLQVSQCDAEALASRFGCLFFEVSACLDFLSVQHVFYEAVRRARRGGERGHLVPAVYISEDKALLSVPSFTTPCYKELPAPATAKLVTVKTSRAQSMRRAATLNLLKGFKIF